MAAVPSDRAFLRALLRTLARQARTAVLPSIPSTHLRDGLRIVLEPIALQARLHIPHYWALYVHDGRGPFGPRRARSLVWFFDEADDPRLRPMPVRYADWRPLTQQEYQEGLLRNAQNRRAGLPPFMIVRKYQPVPMRGTFFFTQGLKTWESTVDRTVTPAVAEFVRKVAKAATPKALPIQFRLA